MSSLLFLFLLFYLFSSTSSQTLSTSPLFSNVTAPDKAGDDSSSSTESRPVCATYNNNCLACISARVDLNCGYCQSHTCEEKILLRPMCEGQPAPTCPNFNHTTKIHPVQGLIPLIGNWNGVIHSSHDWYPDLSVIPIDNHAFVMGMNTSLDKHKYLVGKSGIAYQLIQAATTWDILLLQRDRMPLSMIVPKWYEPSGVQPPIPSSVAAEIIIPMPSIGLTSTYQLGLLFTVSSNIPSTTHTFNIKFSFHGGVNLSVATATASDWTLPYHTSTSTCIRCYRDILQHSNTSRGWAAMQGSSRDTVIPTTLYMSEVIVTYNDIMNAARDANITLNRAILTGIIISQPTPSNKRATSQLMIYATSIAVYCTATDHMQVTPITSSTTSFNQQLDSDYIPWGTQVNITCDSGYLPTGSIHHTIHAICANTKFINTQQQEITCEQVKCKTLPIPSHGTASTTSRVWGTIVTITCEEGYRIAGGQGETNVTYTCGYQGWNGTIPAPKCERSCLPPRSPRNGRTSASIASSFPTGTNVSITCDAGYTHTVTNTICTSINGISDWKPVIPTSCSRICTFNISHLMASRNLIVEQDLVTFTCHSGYILVGTASATCLTTGNWSNPLPTCELLQTTSTPTIPSQNNDTAGLMTNEVSSIASSTVAGITILPIIALVILVLLLLFPHFTPIPGVRMEPGHQTCCLILSSPRAHWIARSKIIHVMPIFILVLQIISIPLILGFNALSSVDGDALHMVGLPSCSHLIASTDCNSTRAGSYLVFIYLILALITSLVTSLIIIQSIRQHMHTHSPSSYRWTVATQLLLLIALLTWFIGPYRTYSHLFSGVFLTWTCCLLIACIALGWLHIPLLHLHIQHGKPDMHTSMDESRKHIEMQTTKKIESSTPVDTPGATTAQHTPRDTTDGIAPTIASATATGTATSAFESQTRQVSPFDHHLDPHHPMIHDHDNTTAIEQQPIVVLQVESPRQLTIHQGEE